MEMSSQFPVKHLCDVLDINRSGFYKWKKRLEKPSDKLKTLVSNLILFKEYHSKYPSHGYRWLNAKIRLDTGLMVSDQYAHKLCKTAGIVSVSKHYRYKKPGDPYRIYPNLLLTGLIELKKKNPDLEMVLHTDQGSVYSSKSFNELLPLYNIVHSMSRAGTPTDNAAMEAINGWIKAEIFNDFHLTSNENITYEVEKYIRFFNEERPAYSLNYLTPKQYREYYAH